MLGIVLWSDPVRKKAIIWCNDHGDLAFVNNASTINGTAIMPTAGALCAIRTCNVGNLRICESVTLIRKDVLPLLADNLLETASEFAA